MKIGVGGAILELPDAATDKDIAAAIKDFRTTPEFDSLIDKNSGAPARVRALVGASPDADKLGTLQATYPDAQPHGEDNFVFTEPVTGKLTLYNPTGIDLGDVASIGREVVQTVAATAGAVAGSVVPGAGTMAGAGLGNVAGGALVDLITSQTGRVATRTGLEVAKDTGIDFAIGAIGQKVGDLLALGGKRIFGGARDAASKFLVDAFESLGIKTPAGAVSGSRAIGTLEHTLENSPASSAIMQRQAEQVLSETKAAADTLAAKFGPALTKQGAGAEIKEAAANVAARFNEGQAKAYQEAFDKIGADSLVTVQWSSILREEMENELARAPAALAKALTPAINMLKAIERDAGEAGINFGALREVRTMIGRDLDAPMLSGSTGAQNAAMKRIYGALTQDLSAAATAAGGDAVAALKAADRYTRIYMNEVAKTMQKIANFEAEERAFEFAMSSAKDGGSALAKLRRHFEPEEWDTVAGTVLGRMGLARAGSQDATQEVFSPNTFLTNWSRLAPEAKEALFGGARYKELAPELDKLVKVVSSIKDMEKLTNTSNTARNMIAWSTITTLGGALGYGAGGDMQSAAGGIVTTIVAPRVAAKLITSPAFVKWMTTPVTNPNGISAHLGRLVAIGEAQPEIKDEIDQYIRALRSIPSPQTRPATPQKTSSLSDAEVDQMIEQGGPYPDGPPMAMTLTPDQARASAATVLGRGGRAG